jgi:hypothetical protein
MAFNSITVGAFIMKKVVIIFTIAFLVIGTISAQSSGRQRIPDRQNIPEPVKIEGTLQLHNGQFAVASGNNTYYVPMIGRYVGFIDALKEGSNVSFEGYVRGNFLMPVKMTISGKSYDLAPVGGASGEGRNKDLNNRNDRNRKERGLNDRGFNAFGPGSCCVPYSWKGRGRR